MPKTLEPGVLYVAAELGAAAHLCPCGCGTKVRTPLSPVDWSLTDASRGPTLYPSIGNWQQPCKSHYWVRNGEVMWADPWSAEEIAAGRVRQEERANEYYEVLARQRQGMMVRSRASRLWKALVRLFAWRGAKP